MSFTMPFTNEILIQNWFILSILNLWGVVSFTTVISSGTIPTLDVIKAFFILLAKLFNYKSTSKLEALPCELQLHVLEFAGAHSCYRGCGAVCKTINQLFKTHPYRRFLSMSTSYGGYARLQEILQKCETELEKGIEYESRDIPEIIHHLASGVVTFNRTDLFIWMIEKQNKYVFQAICERAIKDRKLSIFQKVWNISIEDENIKTYMKEQTSFIRIAAKKGYLEYLKILHEELECEWDEEACDWAALAGHLACLVYLHEKGCPWDEWACERAALGGHLDCLRYLHEQRCEWYEDACKWAAFGGHIDCLKYLHNHGCEWDESACKEAARCGHLDCLVYLHEKRCPWNNEACIEAAENRNLDCLQYMRDNGLEWDRYDEYLNFTN